MIRVSAAGEARDLSTVVLSPLAHPPSVNEIGLTMPATAQTVTPRFGSSSGRLSGEERKMPNARPSTIVRWNLVVAPAACLLFARNEACATSDPHPAPETLQARPEFQDAKFGMFIHWGVY